MSSIAQLIARTVADVFKSADLLGEACTIIEFPHIPYPRGPARYITQDVKIQWNPLCTHRLRLSSRVDIWKQISREHFVELLVENATTPRKAERILSRLDAYNKWLIARRKGVATARANLLSSQQVWVDKLEARIGGHELAAAEPISTPQKNYLFGAINNWPLQLLDLIKLNDVAGSIHYMQRTTGADVPLCASVFNQVRFLFAKWGAARVCNNPGSGEHFTIDLK